MNSNAVPLDESGKIILHQFPGEAFISRLNRRMGGKDCTASDNLAGFIKAEALLFHQHSDPFQDKEGRMALVYMINARLDAQFLQQSHPSPAKQYFLLHPR